MRTIGGFAVAGRRVLVRDDLNVPLDDGQVTDDGRIRAALPALTALTDRGARVIVCAHLGRPAGRPDPTYSLAPAAARLSELPGRPVTLAADVTGPSARAAVASLGPGGVVMLENLRFDARETSTDDAQRGLFAGELAARALGFADSAFGYISTGGGASLEFIQGKTLPGLVVLDEPCIQTSQVPTQTDPEEVRHEEQPK